jgi:hypothetical protein
MLAHLISRAENKTVFDPREIATIKFQAGQGAINRSVSLGSTRAAGFSARGIRENHGREKETEREREKEHATARVTTRSANFRTRRVREINLADGRIKADSYRPRTA